MDLRRTLFSSPIPAVAAADPGWLPRRTVFLDDPGRTLNGAPAGPNSRTRHTLGVRVSDPAIPLRATLVWTDYPGVLGHRGSLVNQLRLSIVRASDGTVFDLAAPAGYLPAPPPPGDLSNNNVQQIDIAAPVAGVYSIHVTAPAALPSFTTRGEEQDFALVVSGSISESDERLPGTLDRKPDLAFVDVAPNGAQHLHDGLAPSAPPPFGNQGSPDIWVNTDANPATEAAHVRVGQRHHVFVRLRNLGFAPATDAQVHLYWADPTSPMAFPGDWKDTGISVGGVPGNARTDTVGPRAERVVGPYEWDPPAGLAQVVLLVRAVHADDPIVNEGDPRNDNNITRKTLPVVDDTTSVQGRPGAFSRFIFWIISGFGSPRDVELVLRLSYQDTRDGSVKPLPAGVEVEILDHDPISADDLLATSHTALRQGTAGPESVVHLTFSTFESGERQPDLYVKVKRPAGAEFAEFLSSSFFAAGADAWESRERPADGFFLEDFTGTRHGVPVPPHVVLRPEGITVQATFESRNPFGEFRPLPAGIPVEILDSAAGSPRPHLGETRTDAQGRIGTVVARVGDHQPERLPAHLARRERPHLRARRLLPHQRGVRLAHADRRGDRRGRRGHDPARPLAPSQHRHARAGRLDPAGAARVARRRRPPALPVLRPRGRRDAQRARGHRGRGLGGRRRAPCRPLALGRLDANGRASLGVSRGGRATIDLFARLVMRRRLDVGDSVANSDVVVTRAGAPVHFDTKGRAAVGGASGTFAGVVNRVPAGPGELTFQLSTVMGDATPPPAAAFALRVIGEAHDWLRKRSGDWTGLLNMTVDLITGAGGSRFDAGTDTIFLNDTHVGFGSAQPDHWNRTAIAHFYGHLVLELLYVAPGRVAPGVPSHNAYDHRVERDRAIAFAEGFAGYVAVAHAGPAAPDPTGVAWRGLDNNGSNSSGEIVPAAVANTLWRIDRDVVQPDHAAITDPVNQRRWRALIWTPIGSLIADARQIPFELYRTIQGAALAPGDLIEGHDLAHVRQLVRTAFEANGIVFTRGLIRAASTVPSPGMRRFPVGPVAARDPPRRSRRADLGLPDPGPPAGARHPAGARSGGPGRRGQPAGRRRRQHRRGARDGRHRDRRAALLARAGAGRVRRLGLVRGRLRRGAGERGAEHHQRPLAALPDQRARTRRGALMAFGLDIPLGGATAAATRAPAFDVAFGSGAWADHVVSITVEAGIAPAVDAAEIVLGAGEEAPSRRSATPAASRSATPTRARRPCSPGRSRRSSARSRARPGSSRRTAAPRSPPCASTRATSSRPPATSSRTWRGARACPPAPSTRAPISRTTSSTTAAAPGRTSARSRRAAASSPTWRRTARSASAHTRRGRPRRRSPTARTSSRSTPATRPRRPAPSRRRRGRGREPRARTPGAGCSRTPPP